MACSGLNCNNIHIQNKKHNLCGECVFKKSHEGKSRQEVYQERAGGKPKKIYQFKNKQISTPTSCTIIKTNEVENDEIVGNKDNLNSIVKSINFKPDKPIKGIETIIRFLPNCQKYFQDEVSKQNEINQNLAELEARREAKNRGEKFDLEEYESGLTKTFIYENPLSKKKKKQKPIKQVSSKQAPIERAYRLTCIDMDHTTEPICTGCGRYQGGDIKLSHSHLISRADCQRIGKSELISERENLTYHCMTYAGHIGCHNKWESPIDRVNLLDYEKNIEYIRSVSEEMYLKYSSNA